MLLTDKGKVQFNKLVNSKQVIEIEFAKGEYPNDPDVVGNTDNFGVTYISQGENILGANIKSSKITIYNEKVEALAENGGKLEGKSIDGLSFNEILGAVVGHEVEHTDPIQVVKTKRDPSQKEVGPTKVSDTIIDQINKNKQKK